MAAFKTGQTILLRGTRNSFYEVRAANATSVQVVGSQEWFDSSLFKAAKRPAQESSALPREFSWTSNQL